MIDSMQQTDIDSLKGTAILIGKEAAKSQLGIVVTANGKKMVAVAGSPGSVPNSVSRCKPAEDVAHCKIDISEGGKMTITNLKSANATFVNGLEVDKKTINPTDKIMLGKDRYCLDLNLVLTTAVRLVASSAPKQYSIKHLERVWNEYEKRTEAIQRRQQRMNKWRMLPLMIGSLSSITAAVCGAMSLGNISLYITIPIAVLSFVIYFVTFIRKDTSIDDRKKATKDLYKKYVCPNPDCRHFMGMIPYEILRQNKKCNYCGCTFTEK
ncbi:MAG: FHA domain-containing protein [Prevotella sp.]|nr:FHA domain-containing protein [Prevotella sp.]